MEIKFSILFEHPFWVGVFEETIEGYYSVSKYIFGNEPTDPEVYELILNDYGRIEFSKPIQDETMISQKQVKITPKRMQRMVKKETQKRGIGTKAQQAISAERELNKVQKTYMSKEKKEEFRQLQYYKKQEKKKQKKRGH